jgi:hypothetical protein
LPEYLRAAARLMVDADRRAIIDHVAAHPTAGDLIEGTPRANMTCCIYPLRNQ